MTRRRTVAFVLVLISYWLPDQPTSFANGFVTGVQSTISISSATTIPSFSRTNPIISARDRLERRNIRNYSIRDRRTTRLFSQTTKLPREPPEPKTLQTKTPVATSTTTIPKKFNPSNFAVTEGPDLDTKPDYENIHGPLGKTLDNIFLWVFRSQLAYHVGVDSKLPKTDYAGLMELAAALNARYSDRKQIQDIAQATLRSLFPSWLPGQFAILFARPFPEFSSRMNAWATYMAGQWLMGECEINDIEIDGKVYKDQGLLVKRCRFLEESGCASVCVNSCKIPTQKFFIEDMGLPLTMTPDYETHECQFSFGRMPTEQDDLDAMGTPCLSRCPTAGSMRKWHNGNAAAARRKQQASVTNIPYFAFVQETTEEEPPPPFPEQLSGQCAFMENPPSSGNNNSEEQRLQP